MILLDGIKISIQQKQTETKENSITNQPKTKKTNFLIVSQTQKQLTQAIKQITNITYTRFFFLSQLTQDDHKAILKIKKN